MSTEQTQDRHRRRTPLTVASVAAAVLLVGGGGAYFAATSAGGSDHGGGPAAGGDPTPPPLALDGYAAGGTGSTSGIAPGEPDPYGTRYQADGTLPTGPGEATVYRSRGDVTAADVTALAKALGAPGTPHLDNGAWKVGPAKDGSGPSLQVNERAPGAWTYARSTPPTGHPVGEGAAEKAAAPVLKALGQDDAKLDASQLMGAVRVVNAEPRVGGLPTYGWTTGVRIGPDGQVVGGSGQLKQPVKGDTYPVISARKTLGLLNSAAAGDGRVGIGGCASPMPVRERDEAPCKAPTKLPAPPAAKVTGATFGLAAQFAQGRQILVPSWLFQVKAQGAREGYTVTHVAVDPRFLTSPHAPGGGPSERPSPRPSVRPGDPGTETRDIRPDGYTVDGRTLTAYFTGGVCGTYEATASESGGEVALKITHTEKKGTICVAMAKFYSLKVTLHEPLDGRKVVDTHDRAVPHTDGKRGYVPAPRS
ncbi:hypothetical protein EOT10_12150 [Streptomyces antnestii]|uniref:Large membrane protein n=1 Tax=Streptomyces antnestii TaxID=2494256 RepID=A0A3S2WKM4_9ACTN|nr:hypothetical protein [Streptomyces sp. San01]RVU26306.1 hypothetical protein EOT10_12150 [Streptomyces sp. San01]